MTGELGGGARRVEREERSERSVCVAGRGRVGACVQVTPGRDGPR